MVAGEDRGVGGGVRGRKKIDDVADALSRAVARISGQYVPPLEKKRTVLKYAGRNRSTAHHGPQHGYDDGGWSNGVRALEE